MPCPPHPSRRRALQAITTTGLATLAGCLDGLPDADSCSESARLSLDEASAGGVSNEFSTPVGSLDHATGGAVAAAIRNDTENASTRGYYGPEMRTEYVVAGQAEAYYRTETTHTDRSNATGYEYAVDIGIDDSAVPADATVHSFEELPPHDRESLRAAIGNQHLLGAPHYDSFSVTFAYEDADSRARSVFVPKREKSFLNWDDTRLRLTFAERRTVEIATTTVTVTRVADSLPDFRDYYGREHGVVLDSLTDSERAIVTQAIEDDYSECAPYSDSFDELQSQIATSSGSRGRLVQYDGQWYFSHLAR